MRTWEDVEKIAFELGVRRLAQPLTGKVSRTQDPGIWNFECKCGRQWAPTLNSFMRLQSMTCGKCEKCTYLDIVDKISEYFEILYIPGKLEDITVNVRTTKWSLRCKRCNKLCNPTTVQLQDGLRSCGCLGKFELEGKRFGKLIVIERILNIPGQKYKSEYRCKCDCGNEINVRPSNLIKGDTVSCRCSKIEFSRSQGLNLECGSKWGKLTVIKKDETKIGKFQDAFYICKCECGELDSFRAHSLFSGNTKSCGCTKSHIENDMIKFIRENTSFEVITHDRTVLKPKELDVYIPELKLAFELDGLRWHGELFRKTKGYHKLGSYHKYRECKTNGIRLVTIFEDEWNNRNEVVKAFISSILNKKQTIGGRKCTVIKTQCNEFINKNHIQGIGTPGQHYALMYNGNLVAVAVFSKAGDYKKKKINGKVYELTRYCLGPNVSVNGGLSKLIKAFLTDNTCNAIITYSDNRWSTGALYINCNFTKENERKPNYWYISARGSPSERIHRFNWTKAKALQKYGGTESDTEWDIMSRNGWDRVWDCGKTRWVYCVDKSLQS